LLADITTLAESFTLWKVAESLQEVGGLAVVAICFVQHVEQEAHLT